MSPIDPRDVRDKLITFRPDTPQQKTAIATAAKQAGMSAAGWIRHLLLDAAGYHDITRRRATRRPNEQPRNEQTGNAPLAARVSAREKTAIEKKAGRAKKDVSDWARDVIEAELRNVGPL